VIRLWSELVPYAEVTSPRVLDMLRARGLGLVQAVTPADAAGIGELVRACRRAGVRVELWPMLSHPDGRWASAANADRFDRWVRELLDEVDGAAGLAVDLEPPIERLRDLLALRPRGLRRPMGTDGACFGALARHARDRGLATTLAVAPLVLADARRAGWQRFLGTPVHDGWDRVSPMIYTSMIEGWSRGWLSRRDVLGLLATACRAVVRRHGPRASASLGLTGPGILGDEPTYRGPDELFEDVAVARGAGVEDLVVHSLDGILARPPTEAWLRALDAAPRPAPALTARAAAVSAAAVVASPFLATLYR
jgi:hypothetical protein